MFDLSTDGGHRPTDRRQGRRLGQKSLGVGGRCSRAVPVVFVGQLNSDIWLDLDVAGSSALDGVQAKRLKVTFELAGRVLLPATVAPLGEPDLTRRPVVCTGLVFLAVTGLLAAGDHSGLDAMLDAPPYDGLISSISSCSVHALMQEHRSLLHDVYYLT